MEENKNKEHDPENGDLNSVGDDTANEPEAADKPDEANEPDTVDESENPADGADDALSQFDKRDGYTNVELESELERLTVVFRDQLQKATEDAEDNPENKTDIKELDEIKEQIEKDIIPEDMLCRCCGERARDISRGEDYEYCEVCREGMKHYPIGIQYLALAVLMVFVSGFSAYLFFKNFDAFYLIRQAQQLADESKMTSAVEKYDEASTTFENLSLTAKRVKLKSIELQYDTVSSFSTISTLSSELDEVLSPFEYKLIWNSKYYAMRNKMLTLSATLTAYSDVVSEYQDTDEDEIPYDTLIADMEALIGQTTEIDAPQSSSTTSILLSGSADKTITVTYDEAFIRFCQYLLLYQQGDNADNIQYLIQVRELAPEYIWLYGYELGRLYAQEGNFDEANEIDAQMMENNTEDNYAYLLKAFVLRLNEQYDEAFKVCDKGIEMCDEVSELYRQKAICYILQGEYDEALDLMTSLVDGSITSSLYIETVYTYAVAADLSGDETAQSDVQDMIDNYSIEYSDRMKSYFAGELSVKQLFTEGNCDVT